MKEFFLKWYLKFGAWAFNVDLEQFKHLAYLFHIKDEFRAAKALDRIDQFKYGSVEAKNNEEVREKLKQKVPLEHFIPNSIREQKELNSLLDRDDLLIIPKSK